MKHNPISRQEMHEVLDLIELLTKHPMSYVHIAKIELVDNTNGEPLGALYGQDDDYVFALHDASQFRSDDA